MEKQTKDLVAVGTAVTGNCDPGRKRSLGPCDERGTEAPAHAN